MNGLAGVITEDLLGTNGRFRVNMSMPGGVSKLADLKPCNITVEVGAPSLFII